MGKIKRIDLFLLRYTLLLAISLISVWAAAALFVVSSGFGTLYPANASELYLSKNQQEFVQTDKITKSLFLPFNQYAVYDESGDFLYGDADDPQVLWDSFDSKSTYLEKGLYIKAIERPEEFLLISYPIKMMYKNNWLRDHFPNPELVLMISVLSASVLIVFIFVKRYALRLSRAMAWISEGVQEIKLHRLNFTIKDTEFKELNEITQSLNLMRDELISSLEELWKEKEQRELQLKALGHDIKTPLTIIRGNAELLAEISSDSETQNMLEEIISSTQHLSDYTKSLRHIGPNRLEEKELVNVTAIFSELQKDSRSLASLNGKKLEWENEMAQSIFLHCERNKLKRAFMNLMMNAVERGTTIVTVSIKTTENIIEFSVKDDGHGFSKESLARATEAFYTDDPSRNTKHQGLGLYVVQSVICEELGGSVCLENIFADPSGEVIGASVKCQLPI
ncbi:sensor histidine kinase [Sporosarcina cascadiensis]|uniref:sensor histidine kinase n=1 Tax=Sporosarcina cascadiensis TaxID=2660747 RepID=UPI00129AD7F3|nr:HAMP domain-containing sensor histidine kinase [Sporosarcina cascadiensis]